MGAVSSPWEPPSSVIGLILAQRTCQWGRFTANVGAGSFGSGLRGEMTWCDRGDKTQLANVFDPSMSGNAQANLIWVCALEPHRIVDSIP
jgi:hypothetical protein